MARWNESEFVARAGRIAHDHAVNKKSLNDLSEKVARDENLQPDEIRTLVRLANVATFQELFKRKDDGDKMVEFEAGDPEAVIHRIVDSAQNEPQSANVHNDKLASAWSVPDFMVETRLGHKFDLPEETKIASDETERPVRKDLTILALRKLAEEFEVEKISAGQRWEELTNKLAAEFRKAPGYGPNFHEFEKDALADFGMNAWPELVCVRDALHLPMDPPHWSKVAELEKHRVSSDTPASKLLEQAKFARHDHERFTMGLTWISDNMPSMEG